MTWKFLLTAFSGIIGQIIKVVSPELRKMLVEMLRNLYEHAKETPNPWDDFLVELLVQVLGIDFEKE
ncbi:hypothetical protein DRN34_01010 [Thermococci archaeon]|nr:MAG: hypothetical protein DRN34_01010 [Thermococci archaeon]